MRNKRLVLTCVMQVSLVFGILNAAQAKNAAAAGLSDMVQNLQEKCKSDIDKLCKDVTPGNGRLAACLESKEDKLSDSCRKTWSGTKTQLSERIDKAEVKFRKSCGNDVQTLCSDVPSGRGRVLECLNGHKEKLSSTCQKYYSSLDEKLAELVG